MKKILILILILILIFLPIQANPPRVGSPSRVEAGFPDDLPGPSVMPDSPFYFLKIWYEKIVLFFTFDAVKKVEKYKTFAEKRAYEIKEMIERGKEDLAEKPKEIYKSYLNKALNKLEGLIKKATERKKEELRQELEKKVEEIKNKLKQAIKIW